MSYLSLFAYSGVQHIFCCVFSQMQCELLPSLGVRRLSSVNFLIILIFLSETPQPNELKLGIKHL
jgi:hypothetical protein